MFLFPLIFQQKGLDLAIEIKLLLGGVDLFKLVDNIG